MKKLIFVLFLSLSCSASEPKFHFKDCVKVNKGFYRDCKGTVEELITTMGPDVLYTVNVEDCKGSGFYNNFSEEDLTLSTGCGK